MLTPLLSTRINFLCSSSSCEQGKVRSTVLLSCLVHTNLRVLPDSTESLSRSVIPAPCFPWGRCSISFGSCIHQPSPAAMPSRGLCDGLCSPGLVLTRPDLPRSSIPNGY